MFVSVPSALKVPRLVNAGTRVGVTSIRPCAHERPRAAALQSRVSRALRRGRPQESKKW